MISMQQLISYLISEKKTISTMESCTGGALASSITNVEGASEVFNFGAVTYSNEFKEKMGVDKEIIDKFSVYSVETAKEMSKKISLYTNSSFGVGITGKFNKADQNNPYGDDNVIFISVYNKESDEFYTKKVKAEKQDRKSNKQLVINAFLTIMKDII